MTFAIPLELNKKNLKQREISAWIPPVVPPVLCLIDNEEKVKLKWYKVL